MKKPDFRDCLALLGLSGLFFGLWQLHSLGLAIAASGTILLILAIFGGKTI